MTAGTKTQELGECRTCGKVRYVSRDQARHAARVLGAKFGCRMRSYEACGGYWHVSSATADEVAEIRAWGAADEICAGCGRVPYPSRGAAVAAAEQARYESTGRGFMASFCGESWHVTGNRWSGRAGKHAMREVRAEKRREALERNQRTDPSRRSAKGRAKRAEGTMPVIRNEAA